MSALVDPDRITSAWTHYAIDRAVIIAGAGEPFLHAGNDRPVVTPINRAVGVVGIARAVVIVTIVSVRVITVAIRISPIIGAAVIRVAAVVSSVKWNAYSDIP